METQQRDTFDMNVNQQTNSNSFKREEVKGTPFQKVTDNKGDQYYLMGDNIIQKATETKTSTEIERQLRKIDWDILIPIIASVTQKIIQNALTEYQKDFKL